MLIDFASRQFYESRAGRAAKEILRARVRQLWPDVARERLLPLGCAELLIDSPSIVAAHMTGAKDQPFCCLADSRDKPLPDASLDRVIALHTAETSEDMDFLLREIWRVLKGEGRVLLILPRRNSGWATNPATPFGREQAYGTKTIKGLLNKHFFTIESISPALYLPPWIALGHEFIAQKIDLCSSLLFFQQGGGVLLVEARKRVHGLATERARTNSLQPDPLFPMPLPI
jgi:hypothetical protein